MDEPTAHTPKSHTHKLDENPVEREEGVYRTLIQTSLDGFMISDFSGRILDVNEALCQMLGYSREELLRMSIPDIEEAEAPEETAAHIQKIIRTGSDRFQTRQRRKDGAFIDVEVSAQYVAELGERFFVFLRDISKLKRAELLVRANERKYRTLLEHLPQKVFAKDRNSVYLHCNENFARDLKLRTEEFAGHTDYDFFPKELADKYRADDIRLMESGQTELLEEKYLLNGEERWVSTVKTPLRDEQGMVSGIIGIFWDITEFKRTNEALHESESRFRQLVSSLPQLVWTCEPDGLCDYLSQKWVAFTGIPEEEQLGYRWLEQLHPDDRAPTVAAWQAAAASGTDFHVEFRIRRHDGEYRWFDTQAVRLSDAEGRTVKWFGSNTDITERKRAEEALDRRIRIAHVFLMHHDDEMFNEVLKVILDIMHSPFGVFGYIDEAGALVVPTMTRQIWDKCQVPDKTFIFPRATWGDSSWPRAIRERKANYSNEISTKTPEGHVAVQRHISLPILIQGEVIGLFQVANKETDYTEADLNTLAAIAEQVSPLLSARLQRDRAQESLRQLNAELEQRVIQRTAQLQAANADLENFSYSVSHDLRAPLRAIDGFAAILREDYASRLDEEGLRLFQVVSDNTRKMAQLIDDILAFSRAGRFELHLTTLDMNALVQQVWQELEPQRAGRAIELRLADLPSASGDPAAVRQVWQNLLANAVKFTRGREPAVIEVGGRHEGEENIYSIRDNGVGFDMAYVAKLFGLFQRLHGMEEFEGTGVGLAIVKRFIAKHGGRVWAEGKVGEGATFWFTLPAEVQSTQIIH